MHASGGEKVLPRSLLLLYKLRLCLCAESVSAESCGKQSCFYEQGDRAIAVIYLDTAILRECEGEREHENESQPICGDCFFLSTLRDKWSRVSKTERENKEKESSCEMLSILPVLLLHLGHLFFRCHLSCQWQMTQHPSGGSGRQSPGTLSPQAKLVRDLVHLPAPPPPYSSSHPIYPASLSFFTWLLVSWFHSSPCSGTFLPLSLWLTVSLAFCFFFFYCCEIQCDWEP